LIDQLFFIIWSETIWLKVMALLGLSHLSHKY
jgi:hypothetical protein